MFLSRKITTLLSVMGFWATFASASSPTPPIVPRLEVDGPGKVRIVLATSASGDFHVTVRKGSARPAAEGSVVTPLTQGSVSKDVPVIVGDALDGASPGDVLHLNYQVEIESKDLGYHGFMAVDQAYAVEGDGTLRAITFEEEIAHGARSMPAPVLADGEVAADAPTTTAPLQ